MKERAQAGETTQDGTNMQTTLGHKMFIDLKRRNARFFFAHETKGCVILELLMDEIRQSSRYGRSLVNYSALTRSNWCRSVSINYTCAVRTHKKRTPGFCARQTIKKLLFHHVNAWICWLFCNQQSSTIFSQTTPLFVTYVKMRGKGSSPPHPWRSWEDEPNLPLGKNFHPR